jgi:hypothetical protein
MYTCKHVYTKTAHRVSKVDIGLHVKKPFDQGIWFSWFESKHLTYEFLVEHQGAA